MSTAITLVGRRTVLGHGQFGVVLKGKTGAGDNVAIKMGLADLAVNEVDYANPSHKAEIQAKQDPGKRGTEREQLKQEATIMKAMKAQSVSNDTIIKYLGEKQEGDQVVELYLEWVDGKSLLELKDTLTSDQRTSILKEVALTLKYLRDKGFCHMDPHGNNVMITTVGSKVKLIDFGIARQGAGPGPKMMEKQKFDALVLVVLGAGNGADIKAML
ncbi:Mitogen-activated protein kinase kinase kinase 6, partial [Mortierella sp. GBA43]